MVWANDDLANATVVSGSSGSITPLAYDSTVDPATSETGEDIVGAGETLWWVWTAPADDRVEFDTLGSPDSLSSPDGLDTKMQVFSGPASSPTHAALTRIATNDDTTTGDPYTFNSRTVFTATAGTTYYIQVDQYATGQAGTLHLSWAPIPTTPYIWTAAATDTFNRANSATTINPSSDGGTWTVVRGGAGITANQAYFPVMDPTYSDALVFRDVGSAVQDVSIDNYRSTTDSSSALILSCASSTTPVYYELDFDSSATGRISDGTNHETVTFTPWTGGTTRLRMVVTDREGRAQIDIYQDGTHVHTMFSFFALSSSTGVSFGTAGHDLRTFDDFFDNLQVLTGVVGTPVGGWQVGSVAMT